MKKKWERLKVHLLMLRNSPKVVGFLMFGLTALFTYFLYLIWIGMTMFYVLSFLAKVNYIFCVVILITSYLLLTTLRNQQQEEIINSIDKGNFVYQKYTYLNLLMLIIILNIIMMGVMVCISLFGGDMYFIVQFIKPYLYNILLPQFICLTFGFILSLFKNNIINIVLMFVFVFMVCPFSELSWPIQPAFQIDKIYHIIHLPFEIFYQNSDWGIDIMYGLQCELSRFWIMSMWCILFLCIYCLKMNFQPLNFNKSYRIISIVCFLGFVGSGMLSYMPESKYRINNSWDGVAYDYYQLREKSPEVYDNDINYKISKYDLSISSKRVLNVDGKLHLSSQELRDNFTLTLDKNYNITELKGLQKFDYQREGDYIYIQFDKPLKETDLQISYRGYHPQFYSNSQAISLPGYFPWYPMSGEVQNYVYQNIKLENGFESTKSCYNKNNRIDEAEIIIRGDRDYITNLNKIDKHIYEGFTDSISLFDGYMELVNYQNIINYLPLNGTLKTKDKYLSDSQSLYMKEIDFIENSFDISLEEYRRKKIIDVSEDVKGRINVTGVGSYAIFSDYIIASQSSFESHLFGGIMETSYKATPLILYLSSISVQESAEETFQKVLDELEFKDAKLLKQKLQDIYQNISAKRLLHEMYMYAFDDTEANDRKFLERLEKL